MSYRMPFPVTFLPTLLIAGLLSLAFPLAPDTRGRACIERTNPFPAQPNQRGRCHVKPSSGPKPELIRLLEKSNIDWNSCKLTASEVLDSWGTPILFDFVGIPDQFEMRSAGPDRQMNTEDDIYKVIQAIKPTP
jgi:hypothetical protein